VEKSRSDGVTAGKALAGPVHEPTVLKRPMSMEQNFHQLVRRHSAGHGDNNGHEGAPPTFKDEKQDGNREDNGDPFARSELSDGAQYADEGRREMSMEPNRDTAIDPSDRISHY